MINPLFLNHYRFLKVLLMKKIVLGLSLVLCSAVSFAADRCEHWGCISTIQTLYTNSDGAIYVGTPLDERLANCKAVSDVYFTLNPNAGNKKEIYSSLLAAYVSGKKIQLRVKENTPDCELSYVRLDAQY